MKTSDAWIHQTRDLGVRKSSKLNVSEQFAIAALKDNRVVGLKSIVKPLLGYCIQAWRPYHMTDRATKERIQRMIAKMVTLSRQVSYEDRLTQCK